MKFIRQCYNTCGWVNCTKHFFSQDRVLELVGQKSAIMPKAFLVKKKNRAPRSPGTEKSRYSDEEFGPSSETSDHCETLFSSTSPATDIMHSSRTDDKSPMVTSLAPHIKATSVPPINMSAFKPFKTEKEKENSPAKRFKPNPPNENKEKDKNREVACDSTVLNLAGAEKREDHGKTAVLEHKEFAAFSEKFEFPKPKGPLPQTQYICQLCKEIYHDPFSLAQHKCSGIQHTEYRCPECDKVFSCPANLASHRRWHRPRSPQEPKKPNPALQAKIEKVTPRETDQQHNFKSESPDSENEERCTSPISNGQGQFVCEVCNKTFRRKAYLRKHMNNHTDDRPYPCQYCGKVFRSLTNRAKHVLNHAVGPKTFTCNVCGNGFSNKGSLDRHSRIHTGEIYSCKHCSSTFYSSPGLTRHINKCHPPENHQVIVIQVPVRQG